MTKCQQSKVFLSKENKISKKGNGIRKYEQFYKLRDQRVATQVYHTKIANRKEI